MSLYDLSPMHSLKAKIVRLFPDAGYEHFLNLTSRRMKNNESLFIDIRVFWLINPCFRTWNFN